MKILLITTHLNFGGISSYSVSLAKELKKQGIEVWIASSGGTLTEILKRYSIPHLKVKINTKSEVSPKVFLATLQLLKFIKREKIDLIHAQTRVTQATAFYLSKLTGIPYVTTCHGFFKPKISRKLWKCWGERVIAISEAVRTHLVTDLKVSKNRIKLIYNGIDLEDFSCNYTDNQKKQFRKEFDINDGLVVGIIARLSNIKGHKYLLLAANEILKVNPDVQFLIIGDGPEKKNLLDLRDKLHMEDNVYFRPSILDTTKALSIIDIFVMPSLQEGLGLSILEAMACSVSVVASDVGGIYSLVEDNKSGFLVAPKDPKALKEAVLKLLNDRKLREAFGKHGQKITKDKFSLAKLIKEVEEVYTEVINNKR